MNVYQDARRRFKFWLQQKSVDRYAFIHINKCGGTSIERCLNIPKIHDTAAERIERMGLRRWEKLHSFAVIRHPYARVVSHYQFRIKKNHKGLVQKRLDLNAWIDAAYRKKDPALYDKPRMFAPCWDWVSVDNEIVVKQLIRLERLNAEWQLVCEKIGVGFKPLGATNRTSGTEYEDAVAQLTPTSLNILNDHFEKDFDAFGFKRAPTT